MAKPAPRRTRTNWASPEDEAEFNQLVLELEAASAAMRDLSGRIATFLLSKNRHEDAGEVLAVGSVSGRDSLRGLRAYQGSLGLIEGPSDELSP